MPSPTLIGGEFIPNRGPPASRLIARQSFPEAGNPPDRHGADSNRRGGGDGYFKFYINPR